MLSRVNPTQTKAWKALEAHAAATSLVKNLARTPKTEHVVLCSHGDVIPEILRDLTMDGVKLTGGRGCAKASLGT